ncbi:MAG TPA: UrcA family protein [Kofleriaceae bacterium]|nr:UrcA family protein [Kofleriaceae bacterium]
MYKFLISLLAASAFATATPALAEKKVTQVVSFADLDLRVPAGRQTLESRIAAAVVAVCGEARTRSAWEIKAVEKCRADAAADAKAQFETHLAGLPPVSVASAN